MIDFAGGWLLDHLLHVTVLFSLPHSRFGSLHWSFPFTGDEEADAILGLGFSPPPKVAHVETYWFRCFKWRPHVARPLLGSGNGVYVRLADEGHLIGRIQHALRYRGKRAVERFLSAVRERHTLNLGVLAADLGWPPKATRNLYRKLEIRGVKLPPLGNNRPARTILVICPHCGRTRHLSPSVALNLDTDVCFECLHRPPLRRPNPLVARCPRCGAKRLIQPRRLKERPGALTTLCRACNLAQGRARGIEWSKSRRVQP